MSKNKALIMNNLHDKILIIVSIMLDGERISTYPRKKFRRYHPFYYFLIYQILVKQPQSCSVCNSGMLGECKCMGGMVGE